MLFYTMFLSWLPHPPTRLSYGEICYFLSFGKITCTCHCVVYVNIYFWWTVLLSQWTFPAASLLHFSGSGSWVVGGSKSSYQVRKLFEPSLILCENKTLFLEEYFVISALTIDFLGQNPAKLNKTQQPDL